MIRTFIQSGLAVMLAVAGCSNSKPPSPVSSSPGATFAPGTQGNAVVPPSSTSAFQAFCASAPQIAEAARFQAFLARLCSGTQPTSLFANDLIAQAFQGAGKPGLIPLEQFTSASGMTQVTLGSALKLPIAAEVQFTQVFPLSATPDKVRAMGINPVKADSSTFQIINQAANAGPFHVQGYQAQVTIQNNKPIPITISYNNKVDWYRFGNGAYLFTHYLPTPGKIMQEQVQYAALIDGGPNASYLIAQIFIKVENLNNPTVAQSTIKSTVEDTLLAVHQLASKFIGQVAPAAPAVGVPGTIPATGVAPTVVPGVGATPLPLATAQPKLF